MRDISQKQTLNDRASVFAIRHNDKARFCFRREYSMGDKSLVVSAVVDNA